MNNIIENKNLDENGDQGNSDDGKTDQDNSRSSLALTQNKTVPNDSNDLNIETRTDNIKSIEESDTAGCLEVNNNECNDEDNNNNKAQPLSYIFGKQTESFDLYGAIKNDEVLSHFEGNLDVYLKINFVEPEHRCTILTIQTGDYLTDNWIFLCCCHLTSQLSKSGEEIVMICITKDWFNSFEDKINKNGINEDFKVSMDDIYLLSANSLSRLLMESETGSNNLNNHDELNSRGNDIDTESCYLLNSKEVYLNIVNYTSESRVSIEYRSELFTLFKVIKSILFTSEKLKLYFNDRTEQLKSKREILQTHNSHAEENTTDFNKQINNDQTIIGNHDDKNVNQKGRKPRTTVSKQAKEQKKLDSWKIPPPLSTIHATLSRQKKTPALYTDETLKLRKPPKKKAMKPKDNEEEKPPPAVPKGAKTKVVTKSQLLQPEDPGELKNTVITPLIENYITRTTGDTSAKSTTAPCFAVNDMNNRSFPAVNNSYSHSSSASVFGDQSTNGNQRNNAAVQELNQLNERLFRTESALTEIGAFIKNMCGTAQHNNNRNNVSNNDNMSIVSPPAVSYNRLTNSNKRYLPPTPIIEEKGENQMDWRDEGSEEEKHFRSLDKEYLEMLDNKDMSRMRNNDNNYQKKQRSTPGNPQQNRSNDNNYELESNYSAQPTRRAPTEERSGYSDSDYYRNHNQHQTHEGPYYPPNNFTYNYHRGYHRSDNTMMGPPMYGGPIYGYNFPPPPTAQTSRGNNAVINSLLATLGVLGTH